MKRKIKLLLLLLICFISITTISCRNTDKNGKWISSSDGTSIHDISFGDFLLDIIDKPLYSYTAEIMADGLAKDLEDPTSIPEYTGENDQISAHNLSAGSLNDNENFDEWKKLLGQDEGNKFNEIYKKTSNYFKSLNRIKINFNKSFNAKVSLIDEEGNVSYQTSTLHDGTAYLFASSPSETYNVKVEYFDGNENKSFIKQVTGDTVIDVEDETMWSSNIDLMLVVDITGSMGDELSYLQAELIDIVNRTSELSNANVNVGIIVYRDFGDDIVTFFRDFTSDVQIQNAFLSSQHATGGGDYPEAVYKALEDACGASWREDSTKILVHVADAPSHDEDIDKWNDATVKLASLGVRTIMVASSGINTSTEYFFRSEALLTSGTYAFLTDHSGYGYSHHETTTDVDYDVEYLNDLLVRLINGYHTGDFGDPSLFKKELKDDPQQ